MCPLVSVIIPVYKVEKYLTRCLDSVTNQTYNNLEIILIDDGSPDKSSQICEEYAIKDSRIQVIHQKNSGVSFARNVGLDIANGEFITFVDGDDYIEKDMYQVLVDHILKENADIAVCGFFQETCLGEFEPYWKERICCVFSRDEQIKNLLSNQYYSCSCCDKLVKKEILGDNRFDCEKKHNEDLLFLYQVMKNSKKAVYISTPYYYYCNNQGSATHSMFNDSMLAIVEINEFILEDIQKNFPDLILFEINQFMRNNISTAMHMVCAGYQNNAANKRIQNNIRKNIKYYLSSSSSIGYKLSAILIAINWGLFEKYVMHRYGMNCVTKD